MSGIEEGDQIVLTKQWTEDREVLKTEVISKCHWRMGECELHLKNGDILVTYHASAPSIKGDPFCKVTAIKEVRS
jgi:hypothetical protein